MVCHAAQVAVEESGDVRRVEEPLPAQAAGLEELAGQLAQRAPQPGAGRHAEPVLRATPDARGEERAGGAAQQGLRPPEAAAQYGGEAERVLRDTPVEERRTDLERHRHG